MENAAFAAAHSAHVQSIERLHAIVIKRYFRRRLDALRSRWRVSIRPFQLALEFITRTHLLYGSAKATPALWFRLNLSIFSMLLTGDI